MIILKDTIYLDTDSLNDFLKDMRKDKDEKTEDMPYTQGKSSLGSCN